MNGGAVLASTSVGHHGGSAFAWGLDLLHDLPVLIAAFVAAAWYVRSARRLDRDGGRPRWPARYSWYFLSGLVLALLVTSGPIAYAAMSTFSMHMVQHIVLMMLAAPLLVMGAPVLLALRTASPERRRTTLVPILRSRTFSIITNPVLSWVAFAAVLVGMHFTPAMSILMDLAPLGHYAEYVLYLGVAMCFYYTLLPGNPARNRPDPAMAVVSLFLMMIPETMTGFFIYSAGAPLYPYFADLAAGSVSDALADQRLGGALMWSASMIIDVAWIVVAVHHWFGTEVAKTRRFDAQLERERAHGVGT